MRRHFSWAMAVATVLLPLLFLFGTAGPAAAATTAYFTNPTSPDNPTCPSGTYTVPAGTRYVQITAAGGAGAAGSTRVLFDGLNPGQGGTGARVTGILPVTPGQILYVVVGRNGAFNHEDVATTYSSWPDGGQNATNNGGGGGSSFVTTQRLIAFTGCKDGTNNTHLNPPSVMNLDRSQMLIVAGGGGGGGNAGSVRSGGNGGNAGARADFAGEAGSDGNHGDISNCYGHGGGGGTSTGPGAGGLECDDYHGESGHGFYGGGGLIYGITPTLRVGSGGAGGGGWYGGGASSNANAFQGGGGGGAGSSYVKPTNYPSSIAKDTFRTPEVTITPVAAPTTTATLSGTTSGNNWFTSATTVTLTAHAGTFGLGKTYYTLTADSGCSAANFHTLERCTEYKGAFTIVGGVHTLTYFSIDAEGLDEAARATSFAVTPTTTAGVTAASLGTGTNPAATAGGSTGSAGSVSVSSTGSGVVGAAVYGANPAGATVFNSSGAFVDVIAPGSGLTGLTVLDCHLNGGTTVSWWDGTAWVLASPQTYDAATGCVTITVTTTSSPNLSQMAGTVFAAGSPPTTTAVATTADGQPYAAGTWTNQSVTVAFTCTAGATPTAPVTFPDEGQHQSASGTCTDGVGQATPTTFAAINVDKTLPSCAIVVTPTVIWTPNGKPVAITGVVTADDSLAGLARVAGGAVTSNEALGRSDVRGFAVNTPYPTPLQLGAVVNFAGTLVATRAGDGGGRTYAQLVTVTDQAGNTSSCTWTVTVPHDQRGRN